MEARARLRCLLLEVRRRDSAAPAEGPELAAEPALVAGFRAKDQERAKLDPAQDPTHWPKAAFLLTPAPVGRAAQPMGNRRCLEFPCAAAAAIS